MQKLARDFSSPGSPQDFRCPHNRSPYCLVVLEFLSGLGRLGKDGIQYRDDFRLRGQSSSLHLNPKAAARIHRVVRVICQQALCRVTNKLLEDIKQLFLRLRELALRKLFKRFKAGFDFGGLCGVDNSIEVPKVRRVIRRLGLEPLGNTSLFPLQPGHEAVLEEVRLKVDLPVLGRNLSWYPHEFRQLQEVGQWYWSFLNGSCGLPVDRSNQVSRCLRDDLDRIGLDIDW